VKAVSLGLDRNGSVVLKRRGILRTGSRDDVAVAAIGQKYAEFHGNLA
jgi:hypothetical protein